MKEQEPVIPDRPYVLRSGKHEGQFIEEFIFKDSDYLFHLRARDYAENNVLKKYLDFVFYAGYLLKTSHYCPFCKEELVKFFLFRGTHFSENLTCCDKPECRAKLKEICPGYDLKPFRISTLGEFKKKNHREAAEIFFKRIYGFPRRVTSEQIFKALKKALEEKGLSSLPIPPPKVKAAKKQNHFQLLLF